MPLPPRTALPVDLIAQLADSTVDEPIRFAALGALSDTAFDLFGADAIELAARLRDVGAIKVVVALLDHPEHSVVLSAMTLIANLLTDAYDVHAARTIEHFLDANGLPKLMAMLHAQPPLNLYAVGAILNVSAINDAVGHQCRVELRKLLANEALAALATTSDEKEARPALEHLEASSSTPKPRLSPSTSSRGCAGPDPTQPQLTSSDLS